jgi:hypothetical protein
MARWRCNAAIATAFNLPSDMWRSRPSRIAADMKVEAIPSALSRASLGGRHAESMWVKAEQSNICATSTGSAMAGAMGASRDRPTAITRFIINIPFGPRSTSVGADVINTRVRDAGVDLDQYARGRTSKPSASWPSTRRRRIPASSRAISSEPCSAISAQTCISLSVVHRPAEGRTRWLEPRNGGNKC